MTQLVLTGFLPENDVVGNASRDLIAHLAGQLPAGWAAHDLPQEGERLAGNIDRIMRTHQPRVLLMCGQAPGRTRLGLELCALNVLDFRMPDALGWQPRDVPIDPEGPLALRTDLLLGEAAFSMREQGYPISVSWHAGTFLCNQALYLALRWIQQHGASHQHACFLHIPLAPSQVVLEPSMADKPCMDTAYVAQATLRLGEYLLQQM